MTVIPAIDLHDGKCVRLMRGDFSTAHRVAESAVETAMYFKECGASLLHMVDLDGARTGCAHNREIISEVIEKTGMDVEVGGGIRSMDDIKAALDAGVKRVIIGSAAVSDYNLVEKAASLYGSSIAVGIDALNGTVRTAGWLENSGIDAIKLALDMENLGVGTIIYTDISKDGMQEGPSFESLFAMREVLKCRLVASGGVTSVSDLIRLRDGNVDAAIIGKAIYTRSIDLKEAIAAVE